MSYNKLRQLIAPDRVAVAALGLSALALALAPLGMPDTYSWFRHTTSESAAQGVSGAWVARLGFLLFGLAVSWISLYRPGSVSVLSRFALGAFGVFMVATAAFSTRPWWPDAAFDPMEDLLHSITATTMGFAFAIGLAARAFKRRDDRVGLVLDVLGIVASVGLPLGMSLLPDWAGLLQRLMFAVAYVWFIVDALRRPAHLKGHHVA